MRIRASQNLSTFPMRGKSIILVGSRGFFLRRLMFFKISIGLYRATLFVSAGQTYEDILLYLKKHHIKIPKDLYPMPQTASARTIHFDDGTNLIEIPKADFKSLNFFESFSHEILHVVFDILNKRGFILSLESEEAYTYLLGYLTKEIMKKMDK